MFHSPGSLPFWTINREPRRTAAVNVINMEGKGMANNEETPLMQRVLDNHFLLVFLGVATPTVLYILWGIMNIISVPLAK